MEKSVTAKMKGFVAILFLIGGSLFFVNLYSFLQGYTAIEKIDSNDFKLKKLPHETKASELKPKWGEIVGELYFPKLKQSMSIYEGTSQTVLKKGVGHYRSSGMPGDSQQIIFSGHRDTVFRHLGQLAIGDAIIVRTNKGEFLYQVKKTKIVDANDQTTLKPKPTESLALTTCYPFHFIGNAPKRYIVTAKRVRHGVQY